MPAADDDGASDPLVSIFTTIHEDKKERMLESVVETQMIENNCDPMFYEVFELTLDKSKGEEIPPFIFDVYDID